jgi:hypothetical protein
LPLSCEVVGSYGDPAGTHGFVYSGDRYTSLDYPGAVSTEAWGINGHGEVVGTYTLGPPVGRTCSFLYSAGTYTTIDNVSQGCVRRSDGIANDDVIDGAVVAVGVTEGFRGTTKFYGNTGLRGLLVSTSDTVLTGIEAPGTSGGTVARGIDDSDIVVGSDGVSPEPIEQGGGLPYGQHGFVDRAGTYARIDYPGADYTVANGIDNVDPLTGGFEVVGTYTGEDKLGNIHDHGFVASVAGVIVAKP